MNGVRNMNDGVKCPTGSSASGAGRVVAMALAPDVSQWAECDCCLANPLIRYFD